MEKFIIKEGGQGEIVEKKSRFIATVLPIDTEEEALQYIERIILGCKAQLFCICNRK